MSRRFFHWKTLRSGTSIGSSAVKALMVCGSITNRYRVRNPVMTTQTSQKPWRPELDKYSGDVLHSVTIKAEWLGLPHRKPRIVEAQSAGKSQHLRRRGRR